MCQCGIDGNCVDRTLPCNCDSFFPADLTDSGNFDSILPMFVEFLLCPLRFHCQQDGTADNQIEIRPYFRTSDHWSAPLGQVRMLRF